MRKLLGRMEIWIDDEDTSESSGTLRLNGSNLYTITLRPTADKDHMPEGVAYSAPDILAHELGHLISGVLDLPGANGIQPPFAPKDAVLKEEYRAWDFARKMYPNLNPKLEEWAINGYKRFYEPIPDIFSILRGYNQ